MNVHIEVRVNSKIDAWRLIIQYRDMLHNMLQSDKIEDFAIALNDEPVVTFMPEQPVHRSRKH